MKLLRLVVAVLSPKQEQWERFRLTDAAITLGTVARLPADADTKLLMCADVALEALPAVSGEGYVLVPAEARIALEESLERAVDLIALAGHASRHIWSPIPDVLLLPEDDVERAWLADKRGIESDVSGSSCVLTDCRFAITDETLGALVDRWDGVGFLADAIALHESMSQFRELTRFFERAFARSSSRLSEPLSEFLADAPMRYSRDEVNRWTVELRHTSIHADRSRHAARPRDAFYVAPRMVAAGYDVLLNKVALSRHLTSTRVAAAEWESQCWAGRSILDCWTASEAGVCHVRSVRRVPAGSGCATQDGADSGHLAIQGGEACGWRWERLAADDLPRIFSHWQRLRLGPSRPRTPSPLDQSDPPSEGTARSAVCTPMGFSAD